MERDYQSNSHPLEWYPATPDMISEMFDTITYEKGGSVLMQAEAFVFLFLYYYCIINYLSELFVVFQLFFLKKYFCFF